MSGKGASLLAAVVFLAVSAEPAIPPDGRFTGVTKVTVVVDLDLKDDLSSLVIAKDFRTVIEGRLRAIGLTVIPREDARGVSGICHFEVKVLGHQATDRHSAAAIRYVYAVMGSLRDYTLAERREAPGPVERWSDGVVDTCEREHAQSGVERGIGELLDSFASVWRKSNGR